MKLSDFKLGMKVVKVGGVARNSVAIVTKMKTHYVTVTILTSTDLHEMHPGDEYNIRTGPDGWEPIVTQFRNK